jgi:hypothetical protein
MRPGYEPTLRKKRADFRALHEWRMFSAPDAWSIGGANRLEALGYAACNTIGSQAWTLGLDAHDAGETRNSVSCFQIDLADWHAGARTDGVRTQIVEANAGGKTQNALTQRSFGSVDQASLRIAVSARR